MTLPLYSTSQDSRTSIGVTSIQPSCVRGQSRHRCILQSSRCYTTLTRQSEVIFIPKRKEQYMSVSDRDPISKEKHGRSMQQSGEERLLYPDEDFPDAKTQHR